MHRKNGECAESLYKFLGFYLKSIQNLKPPTCINTSTAFKITYFHLKRPSKIDQLASFSLVSRNPSALRRISSTRPGRVENLSSPGEVSTPMPTKAESASGIQVTQAACWGDGEGKAVASFFVLGFLVFFLRFCLFLLIGFYSYV